ncbi:MAG: Hpt domain-containing protein [Bacteroidetes bacterium]|nr:Hpt domain-containing protein [Bacteroidota bacterium]
MDDIQTIKKHLKSKFKLSQEQIEIMIPSFVDALNSHQENLKKAIASNDLAHLGRAGHTIKGAFLNLGLDECAAIALKIEEGGKAGDVTVDYERLILQLERNLKSIL